MVQELSRLEKRLKTIFSETRTKLEKDILVSSQDRSIDLVNLYIEVKSVSLKDNILNLKTIRSKPIPPGAVFSLQVITELSTTKEVLENLELFTKDDKFLYLNLNSLKSSEFTFTLNNSNLIINSR